MGSRKEKYEVATAWFQQVMPEAETELNYTNGFELLVAVILSAQCTDKLVNKVTPPLFEAFPTPEKLAKASIEEVNPYIRSVTYHNQKTKHLIGMAQMLMEKHGGNVPSAHEDLVKLPGVGRKTANVIVSVLFDTPAMPVDTHVFRVSQRIGLVKPSKTPLEVEKQLLKHVPNELMGKFHHWLILHGRYVCKARTPLCEKCGLTEVCDYFNKVVKKGLRANVKL